MVKVFQYGSNCDEERLNAPERLSGDAERLGKARTVERFKITFDVWSRKNKCAAADLVRGGNRKAWGSLYEVTDEGLKRLAEIEGKRYGQKQIEVTLDGEIVQAVTFLVKDEYKVDTFSTSAKYVCHIIKGLRDFDVPERYVQHVIDVAIANVEAAAKSAVDERAAIEKLRTPGNELEKARKERLEAREDEELRDDIEEAIDEWRQKGGIKLQDFLAKKGGRSR